MAKQTKKTEEGSAKNAKATAFTGRYKQGVGGRKTATAQVRIFPKQSGIVVNGKDYKEYFKQATHQLSVVSPLKTAQVEDAMGVSVIVMGGGIAGQADAVRNGIARALVSHDPEMRKALRRDGHMTRDPRAVERKKYGLKKARRAPQWAKR
jgi:small subunit ribosomal protein S9